jgi:hypothetical protein
MVVEEIEDCTVSKSVSDEEAVRYSSPEPIEGTDVVPTTYADTYSFAMLILECITEGVPFSNFRRAAVVVHARICS